MRLSTKEPQTGLPMGTPGGNPVWVAPHHISPPSPAREDAPKPFVSYFWQVPQGKVGAADINMEVFSDTHTVAGMTVDVPTMKNKRDLEVGEKLLCEPWAKRKA